LKRLKTAYNLRKAISSLLIFLSISLSLYSQSESNIYGLNIATDGLHIEKINLSTGILSNCSSILPHECDVFSSAYTPAIDPIRNRYYIISYGKLWSIDINTGDVINSYDIGDNALWCMQYNFLDNSIYGINIESGGLYLGKIDLNTGILSSCTSKLPQDCGAFGSQYSPAIDPFGNRYFRISYSKLWSIDLSTGEILNSYDVSDDDLWCMQYNFLDSTLYGINIASDGLYLEKFNFNTGKLSNCPNVLPQDCGSFGSQYFPAIDPLGNRYFRVSSNKLWSIDLNTGQVLNTYDISDNDLWCMQYNYIESITGIKPSAQINLFDIYPNPAQDYFYIESGIRSNKCINIRITDIQGNVLLDKYLNSANEKIDISRFKKGIYILEWIGKQESGTKKVLKY